MTSYWLILKDIKQLHSAGKYHAARNLALRLTRVNDPLIVAIALHRVALTQSKIGQAESACTSFESSIERFKALNPPNLLGLAIVTRDYELHCVRQLGLTASPPTEARERLKQVIEMLEMLESSHRVKLEIVVTNAFVHRVEMFVNGDRLMGREQLWSDWREIRDLRGLKKPTYELEALDWLLRFEHPLWPNELVRRKLALSLLVGNPLSATHAVSTPTLNALSRFFS